MSENLEAIDALLAKVKGTKSEEYGMDYKAEPEQHRKKPEEVTAVQDKKTEKEAHKMEGTSVLQKSTGLSEQAYEAAKAEFGNFYDFLKQYRAGEESAFNTKLSEGDDVTMAAAKTRPPQKWFEDVISFVEGDLDVQDPAALTAWLWQHWVSPEVKNSISQDAKS